MVERPFGKRTVAEVRDEPALVDDLRKITGLSNADLRDRLADAAGNMHVRRLFRDVWPSTASALAERTAAFAREYELHREIQRVTRATRVLVSRRLNEAAGKTQLRNVFHDYWPDPDAADEAAIDGDDDEDDEGDGRHGTAEESLAGAFGHGSLTRSDPHGDPTTAPAVVISVPSTPARDDGRRDPRDLDGTERVEFDDAVEEEDTAAFTSTAPFDPNEIRVKLWTPTVDLVLTRLREKEIDLAPDFQREAGIWKDRVQSRLIESLLIRVPLPAFYMDSSDEDRLLVIDGIQRLTAMKRFVIDDELVLQDLEYLDDCNGKRFSELARPFRRRIEETMLTVHVIDKGTPDGAKLNIFKRLNTAGLPLTPQEVRHAMSPGPVRDFLKELAASSAFQQATQGRFTRDRRMTDRECVLRFCAFVLTPPWDYPATGDLDRFLLDAMKALNAMSQPDRRALARRLDRAMLAAARVLGDQAFRKPGRSGRPRPPVNKALFEAWAVGFDARTDEELEILQQRGGDVQGGFKALIEAHREFEQALSQGTGDPAKVRMRFKALDTLLADVASRSPPTLSVG